MPLTFYLSSPYRIPIVSTKWAMYGFSGTPSVIFDGTYPIVGGVAGGTMYSNYLPYYNTRAATTSPLLIESSYTVIEGTASLTGTITVDGAVPAGTNQVQIYVALADEHSHVNMVMQALATENLTVGSVGQQQAFARTFTVPAGWDLTQLRIITMVQNMSSEEIVQAGQAVPDYKAGLVIDCEPDGVEAGWTLTGPYGVVASGHGDASFNTFYSGQFTLSWDAVAYWTAPPGDDTQVVADGGQLTFTGSYTGGPFLPATAAPGQASDPTRGLSLVDFDGDGDLDVHLVNEGAADMLLRNDDGDYVVAGSGAILDTGAGYSAAWADINGDGHLDTYLGRNGQANVLLLGDGQGGFSPANTIGLDDVGAARSVGFVDYDRDGKLDIYVVNSGGPNKLLHNLGDLGGGLLLFIDANNGASDSGAGRGMAWADIDFDGRLDVYVTNGYGANVLLQNTSFGFNSMASAAGVADVGNGAGAAWGDYDNDGDWDLYLANDGTADKLYNAEDWNTYIPLLGANLNDNGHARGVAFVDIDNDGNLDLYVTRNDATDLMLLGDGAGNFQRVFVGWSEATLGGSVPAFADADGDGDLDLFLARDNGLDVLFENAFPQDNHWFAVKLKGAAGNPSAIGALVKVTSDGVTRMRQVTGGGYLGVVGGPAHFGLGASGSAVELEITWPDGTVQAAGPLPIDRVLDVTYGQPISVSGVDDGGVVPAAVNALSAARPNPFNPSTTIAYSLAVSGSVRLEVFSVDGRRVAVLVDGVQDQGAHSVVWQGRDDAGRAVASGTYMYRLTAPDGEVLAGRMALVK